MLVIARAAIIVLNYNYTPHNRARFKYSLLILIRNKNGFALDSSALDEVNRLASHRNWLQFLFQMQIMIETIWQCRFYMWLDIYVLIIMIKGLSGLQPVRVSFGKNIFRRVIFLSACTNINIQHFIYHLNRRLRRRTMPRSAPNKSGTQIKKTIKLEYINT